MLKGEVREKGWNIFYFSSFFLSYSFWLVVVLGVGAWGWCLVG
jgi:hypothetical protein